MLRLAARSCAKCLSFYTADGQESGDSPSHSRPHHTVQLFQYNARNVIHTGVSLGSGTMPSALVYF